MALSAPHWVKKGTAESNSLNSWSPFSLQNAVRLAAGRALSGEGYLGQSNWSSKEGLRDTVFMMEYWEEEKKKLEQKLRESRPHVLFIGAMTLAFPGAIQVARLAKEILGEEVLIVLGGKHSNETFFEERKSQSEPQTSEVKALKNTKGSPLSLIESGKIDNIFDLVCSGSSEELIATIAERVGELVAQGLNPREVRSEIESLVKVIPGDWRAGWVESGGIKQFQSNKIPINFNEMPIPAELFGINGKFEVYGRDLTAHAFSDTSPGCVFDCFFCSERNTLNGPLHDREHSADRLFRQLKAIKDVANKENSTDSVSVFVEDSTLLNIGKNPTQLYRLADLMRAESFKISFGGQFTIDQILDPEIQEAILVLKEFGLSYVFLGIETGDNEIAKQMSKNLEKDSGWTDKNEQAMFFLQEAGINCGAAVLLGLGENQETRVEQLDRIKDWQRRFGQPVVVSLNLATIHPSRDEGLDEEFIEWGTPADSPYLEMFQKIFGEASTRYAIDKEHLPSLSELAEIKEKYRELELHQENRSEPISILENKTKFN